MLQKELEFVQHGQTLGVTLQPARARAIAGGDAGDKAGDWMSAGVGATITRQVLLDTMLNILRDSDIQASVLTLKQIEPPASLQLAVVARNLDSYGGA